MNRRTALLSFAAAIMLAGAWGVPAADTARARLERFTHGIHSLSCNFEQQVTSARGDRQPVEHGTLALESPRQFRWQTEAPQKQLIVADGARVWIYDPELEQATVRRQSAAEAHSPLTVLTDLSRLDKDFTISEKGVRGGLTWMRLTPKGDDPQFKYAEIGFDGQVLRQMVFTDTLGGESRIIFSDWQRNPPLPSGTFQFKPPAGVDVIGDVERVPDVRPLGGS
ncbi:MAG: outer membrane lipoprotein chaperone LolA [Rhodanobacteraceae bacterium]